MTMVEGDGLLCPNDKVDEVDKMFKGPRTAVVREANKTAAVLEECAAKLRAIKEHMPRATPVEIV